jgi:hypothetical protein
MLTPDNKSQNCSTANSDREQADPPSEPRKSEDKPLQLSDEEWRNEYIIDELQRDLASVKQQAIDQTGQIVIIRKYQSLCRRLGRFIPIADPTPEYAIHISDLKPEVRRALEKIPHAELKRLLAHQAVLKLFEAVGIEPYTSIGRKLTVKFIGAWNGW